MPFFVLFFTFLLRKVKPKNFVIKGGDSTFCNIIFFHQTATSPHIGGRQTPALRWRTGVCEKKQPYAIEIYFSARVDLFSLFILYRRAGACSCRAHFLLPFLTRHIKKTSSLFNFLSRKLMGVRGSAPGKESGRGAGQRPGKRKLTGVRGGVPKNHSTFRIKTAPRVEPSLSTNALGCTAITEKPIFS